MTFRGFWAWLRRNLGACKDRWFHDWNDEETKRNCKVCGLKQVCVGTLQPDVDLTPMRQWETVKEAPDEKVANPPAGPVCGDGGKPCGSAADAATGGKEDGPRPNVRRYPPDFSTN